MVEEEATQTGTVFDENGLRMRRCIYWERMETTFLNWKSLCGNY